MKQIGKPEIAAGLGVLLLAGSLGVWIHPAAAGVTLAVALIVIGWGIR